jgi:hypothetical protein
MKSIGKENLNLVSRTTLSILSTVTYHAVSELYDLIVGPNFREIANIAARWPSFVGRQPRREHGARMERHCSAAPFMLYVDVPTSQELALNRTQEVRSHDTKTYRHKPLPPPL